MDILRLIALIMIGVLTAPIVVAEMPDKTRSDKQVNMLVNHDFATRLSDSTFEGWRLWDETVRVDAVENGVVLTVVQEKNNRLSEFGQRIMLDRKNVNLYLTCQVKVPKNRMAHIQIKLFRNDSEIGRRSTRTGNVDGDGFVPLGLFVNSGEADMIQVNLRTETVGCVGCKAVFTDLKLVETDRQIFPDWKESSGKFQRITSEGSDDNETDLFRVYLYRSTGGDYQVPYLNKTFEKSGRNTVNKNTKMEFSARVGVTFVNFAYLKAELFVTENSRRVKIGEFVSQKNRYTSDVCRVCFEPGIADSVALSLCFDGAEHFAGEEASAKDFYYGPERADYSPCPAPDRTVQVVPGYMVSSIYINNCTADNETKFQSTLEYRERGSDKWLPTMDLVYVSEQRNARGTIVNLRENTVYEYQIKYNDDGTEQHVNGTFITKTVSVPVYKRIVLGDNNNSNKLGPQRITESGTAEGYIRYVLAAGKSIDGQFGTEKEPEAAVTLDNVSYVILDGLTVRGGSRHGISITNCNNVHVVNCDIAGFGRVGEQRIDLDGKYYIGKQMINNDAGICVSRTSGLLVERNWVHDPRGTANSWFYSHPAGPNALCVGGVTDAAIRYNDFIGSDVHRWNDVAEGMGNGSNNGAICRDAEICGNFFGFGNDDGMELDGGQVNARFFLNRTEGCLCGVSTAPCRLGPAWYYRNVFCNAGDEFDFCGLGIKNVFGHLGRGRLHFYNNTVLGHGGMSGPGGESGEYTALASRQPRLFKAMARNNLYGGGSLLNKQFIDVLQSDFDYDLIYQDSAKKDLKLWQEDHAQEIHGVALESDDGLFRSAQTGDYRLQTDSPASGRGAVIPNFIPANGRSSADGGKPNIGAFPYDGAGSIPFRPVPFDTSVQMVNLIFSSSEKGDSLDSQVVDVTVGASGWQGENTSDKYSGEFTIVQPEGADFFSVSPQTGRLEAGERVRLTVKVNPAGVRDARRNTSAFAIRTRSGFSRVVSVTVDSCMNTYLLDKVRKEVVYAKIIQPLKDGGTRLVFDIPAEGQYWFFAKSGSKSGTWRYVSFDGGERKRVIAQGSKRCDNPWISVSTPVYGGEGAAPNRPVKLSQGEHEVVLYGYHDSDSVPITAAGAAENPDAFRLAP